MTSFKQLKELSLERFASMQLAKRTITELFSLEQKEKESLRNWYDRFSKASTEVEGLTQREAVTAFQRSLRNEDLTKSLIITPPNSFADVFARARKFMVVEESASAWKKKEHIATVLNEIERLGLATPPQVKKKGDMGNDPNSYCRYHKVRGHDTENCKMLKVEIEKLIQASHQGYSSKKEVAKTRHGALAATRVPRDARILVNITSKVQVG
ncbi:hypothetical protein CRG98_043370 [Punica granatum]|uniref:Retrotransposon gag domain-containing protein n=1 Tax=Punica granatum TaxID=22663 RepID=A0A2I0HWZ9_PUNGR|nr:hypothetical protein CRG98_043370 [Punica granatum]